LLADSGVSLKLFAVLMETIHRSLQILETPFLSK